MDSWRIYGAMTMEQPEQKEFDTTIGELSRKRNIRQLILQGLRQQPSKEAHEADEIWKLRLEVLKSWIKGTNRQLPLMWATQEEVKTRLKEDQEKDELAVIQYLAEKENDNSQSSRTIVEWKLNRSKVRDILRHLASNRKLQATFVNLVGATRFKEVKEGKLRHTLCPRCKEIDSWDHCITCYGVNPVGTQEHSAWLQAIEKMMTEITTDTPAKHMASDLIHERCRTG